MLSANNLGDAEYRFGDLTKSMFGEKKQRVYVQVEPVFPRRFPAQQTRVVEARGGAAAWGESLRFALREGEAAPAQTRHTLQVFDARGVQASLRGDPLIGEAQVSFSGESGAQQWVTLQRKGKQRGKVGPASGVFLPWEEVVGRAQNTS